MAKTLITTTNRHLAGDNMPPLSAEAFFVVDNSTRLVLKLGIENPLLASYLAHCITRNPQDLRAHTQRVYLHFSINDNEGLYSALLDLFIALGEKGLSLRQLLLAHSRKNLLPQQLEFLEANIIDGLHPNSIIENCGNSLLHSGIESSLAMIIKQQRGDTQAPPDPLQDAQEYLEYGQLDLALDVLETAMEKDPGNKEISKELLQIYILARAFDRYQQLAHKLLQSGHDLPPGWEILDS